MSTFFSTICTRGNSSVLRPLICRGLSVLDHVGLEAFSDVQTLVELRALVRLDFIFSPSFPLSATANVGSQRHFQNRHLPLSLSLAAFRTPRR